MTKARDLANASTALSAVSATELAFVDGVTSAIQTQIDAKIGSASAINPTIVDAKGDIIAATAADTVARLAVGANGTVLTAASGQATGLEWATPSSGSMTLLSTTTLSGASTTISSISGSYKNLYVVIFGVTNATANGNFRIAPNNSSTITSSSALIDGLATTFKGNYFILYGTLNAYRPDRTSATNAYAFTIDNYASTTANKTISASGIYTNAEGDNVAAIAGAGILTTSAITSLVFSNSGGNLSTGTVLLYGVN
jgi:hypothetical protein